MTAFSELPDLSTPRARLQFALAAEEMLKERQREDEKNPLIIIAAHQSGCPACSRQILKGDVAGTWRQGDGWHHAACMICQHCGDWRRADGTCTRSG